MCLYKYNEFKELAKLILTFSTYYSEKHERVDNYEFICPTCGKRTNSKAQLTIHRKNTQTCVEEYWREMKEWKLCENEGCGMLFKTYKDVEKHMNYHCNNNEEIHA